jgi:hypothetical protein
MISYIWSNGAAFALLLAASGSCVVGAAFLVARPGEVRPAVRVAAVAFPLMAILSITLTRDGWPSHFSVRDGLRWTPGGWERFSTGFGSSHEIWFNVALFVPAAIVLTGVAGWRPLKVLPSLIAVSGVVEFLQGVLQVGTPDSSDLLANSTGSTVGVIVSSAALCLTKRQARPPRVDLVLLVVVSVGLLAYVPIGASLRQHRIEDRAEKQFTGQTLQQYQEWSRNDELPSRVFRVDGVFSSGAAERDGSALVRYPTSFMGITQCVIVRWTPRGTKVSGQSGKACLTFLG